MVVAGATLADDGTGAIVKLLDVTGAARPVSVRPGAYAFRAARRANFAEMNGDPVPVSADGGATLDVAAWGSGALRLFTPPGK